MTRPPAATFADGHVRVGERFAASFQRTLRIPEDGEKYPLPPSLGRFPLREHEGVGIIPMHQREALWIGFDGTSWKPNACIVLAGGVNALTGMAGADRLDDEPQTYVVTPYQPWLDGFNAGDGWVRQFVALPLGAGLTAEGAVTGREDIGGLELVVFEPKPGRFPDEPPREPDSGRPEAMASMGLGGGGIVRQRVYEDPYGLDVWDPESAVRFRVALLNSEQWERVTGRPAPPSPVTAEDYARAGLPWFELYDQDRRDVAPAGALTTLPPTGPELPGREPAGLPVRRLTPPALAGTRHQGGSMSDIHVCIDRVIPVGTGEELAAVTAKKWENGSTLKVRFLDGDPGLQQRVADRARGWESYANIRFNFGDHDDAQIRVAFVQDGSSWSGVGTDALNIDWFPPGTPTMNFGWLTPASDDDELSRVVLHEFGHALGCIHEHSQPEAKIPWDKPAVYRYYEARGWGKDLVDHNIFRRYDRRQTQYTEYDPTSIMQYPVPRELTIGGQFEIGLNTALSDADKRFMSELYPGAAATAR